MSATTAQLVLPTPLAEPCAGWPFITAITASGGILRGEVQNLGPLDETFRWYVSWGYSEQTKLADKGITWIPGWHDKDSPEVNARKTAFALKENR